MTDRVPGCMPGIVHACSARYPAGSSTFRRRLVLRCAAVTLIEGGITAVVLERKMMSAAAYSAAMVRPSRQPCHSMMPKYRTTTIAILVAQIRTRGSALSCGFASGRLTSGRLASCGRAMCGRDRAICRRPSCRLASCGLIRCGRAAECRGCR